jgi:hypothetical protein
MLNRVIPVLLAQQGSAAKMAEKVTKQVVTFTYNVRQLAHKLGLDPQPNELVEVKVNGDAVDIILSKEVLI